ncbi:MAG: sulfur carrier protein ThiS [Synergistaceae bacterium]|jgi:sulfur carrier protein|nr:sulfur carrier protein ThiS [Synergistaceae bacterium]
MNLIVAGARKEYEDGLSVAELIVIENVETPMYVSVSVNDEFIKSGEFETTIMKENDNVEFLYFMGGGE